jgi:hypothetical protein
MGTLAGALTGLAILIDARAADTKPNQGANKRIGIDGDFYWELSQGKVELVHGGGRIYYGRYVKTNATWIWIDDRQPKQHTLKIQPSWWRLRFVDETTGQKEISGYRRF